MHNTLSALLNVALRLGFRETQWLEPDRAAWLLGFDIAELEVVRRIREEVGDEF